MKKTALIIGATGLVGSCLLRQLLEDDDYSQIKVFGRRLPQTEHPKLKGFIVDFDHPDSWSHELKGDVLFSTLGTTLKKAGTKANQYMVDYTYQYETAKSAAQNNVAVFVLVSSIGANPDSQVFYSRIKGELDAEVMDLGFRNIFILRPSGLIGDREEERAGENMMIKVTNVLCWLIPFLRKYKPIPAETVASAMINLVKERSAAAYQIIENPEIFTKSESYQSNK